MKTYVIKYGEHYLGNSKTLAESKLVKNIENASKFDSKKSAWENGRIIDIGSTIEDEEGKKFFINKRYEIVDVDDIKETATFLI